MIWFARADAAVQKFTAAPSEGFKVWFGRSLRRAWRWMVGSCFENSENCRDLRGIQNYIDRCLKSANAYEDYGTGKSAEEIAFEVILLMHFTREEMSNLAWSAVARLVQVRLEILKMSRWGTPPARFASGRSFSERPRFVPLRSQPKPFV